MSDSIDRTLAIATLVMAKETGSLMCKELKGVIEVLNRMPPAQPERKRGKWIEDDDGWDGVIWRCSECDAVFTLIDGTPKENEYYFCPHCGADMREVDDERLIYTRNNSRDV